MEGKRQTYGRLDFETSHIEYLLRLSGACSGWIDFDDRHEEVWVSAMHWNQNFEEWEKKRRSRLS